MSLLLSLPGPMSFLGGGGEEALVKVGCDGHPPGTRDRHAPTSDI